VTAEVVKRLVEEGRTLEDLTSGEVEEAARKALGKSIKVSSTISEKISDPIKALNNLRSPGSPHPAETSMAVESRRELKERYTRELGFLKVKLEMAKENLLKAVEQYTS